MKLALYIQSFNANPPRGMTNANFIIHQRWSDSSGLVEIPHRATYPILPCISESWIIRWNLSRVKRLQALVAELGPLTKPIPSYPKTSCAPIIY